MKGGKITQTSTHRDSYADGRTIESMFIKAEVAVVHYRKLLSVLTQVA